MKSYLTITLLLLPLVVLGQSQKTEIMTLGTFHFNFPNLDVKKVDAGDQIDVLDPKYQKEIETIVARLTKFNPTIIVIEREPFKQSKYDSLYNAYLEGKHQLTRNEEQQIGFRLAKQLHLKKLYCVDADGKHYEDVNTVVEGKDSVEYKNFESHFYKNDPDTAKLYYGKSVYKTKGIIAELRN